MTAEIVIMNREAVALAADSAVTYRDHRGEKVFPSANKIFTLSKHHPVGIMIYGGAEFMGVPWETVIKVFRAQLGRTAYSTLQEYAAEFFTYLSTDRRFSPKMRQHAYVEFVVTSFLSALREEIREVLHTAVDAAGEISQQEAKEIFGEQIGAHHKEWKDLEFPQENGEAVVDQLRDEFKGVIDAKKKEIFPRHLTSASSRKLTELALWCLAKSPAHDTSPHSTGVVFVGFGEDEIFPLFLAYAVGGVICDQVQVRSLRERAISRDERAFVAPFAQQEMVRTFMEGIDPDYGDAIFKSFSDIVLALPGIIADDLNGISDDERSRAVKKYKSVGRRLLVQYREALDNYRQERHVAPIVRAIGVLPKNELAAVAESLVNITAFKRRVSMDAETVGGPIDVAVISKGDGFVWIKRKHYFDPALNQHFLQNYLPSEPHDAKEEE